MCILAFDTCIIFFIRQIAIDGFYNDHDGGQNNEISISMQKKKEKRFPLFLTTKKHLLFFARNLINDTILFACVEDVRSHQLWPKRCVRFENSAYALLLQAVAKNLRYAFDIG